ncbi:subclass B3 metallo-beta-lactamase [uncultured Chitinophaga sp.]|uniref:subclass B3 metallo-beta-lactamase n=1 Tax=uncultured Chitinophaga sp. TaxID=339340 RepID=UPI0025FCEEB2|nr:subclass B3 metallo-beta-lactamase [uncultured Chitinophaga sp.]
MNIFPRVLLAAALLGAGLNVVGQTVKEPQNVPADWAKPYKPFRIAGNLYYVGTYDLSCYLVTTPEGNILINTGLAASAATIKANIATLGFKYSDTRILLTTQAHYDHMGAMAAIKQQTGAVMMANAQDAAVMADGGKSDYALGGDVASYQPVKTDKILKDGDTISLGGTKLVMLFHPGHTKGSCSFLLDVKDQRRTYRVLIANMPTIVTDKPFNAIPSYPAIEKDYAYTLKAMKALKFDIWVSSHASQFGLHKKHKPGDKYNPMVFADRKGYDDSLAELEKAFLKKTR